MFRRTSTWAVALVLVAGACKPGPSAQQQASATATAAPSAEALRQFSGAPALQAKLRAAVKAKGQAYTPRTKHLEPDGSPTYTNRLILESSPYLLQHAHNPVNWFPWGDEAFALAKALGRPVFLSVGYSTCHWCHVMEEESFEDEEIAAYLNAHYVPIKVDREERPDVDAVYMQALHATGQRGGWPMSVWLTPDRQPFYGATYIPPRDGSRGRRKGFLTILAEQRDAFDEDPARVAADAEKIAAKVRADMAPPSGGGVVDGTAVVAAIAFADRRFDATFGGAKGAPKFPSSFPTRLLLQFGRRAGDDDATKMALTTLRKMAAGGIHDHVGGGFHRYSVDREWLVPHFEKMLYDQALLTLAYLDGYQQSGDEALAAVARRTLDYVAREMTHPRGGFYSATDADSPNPAGEREEGWFFTWTPAEVKAVLDDDLAAAVIAHYAVTAEGNFEGRSILHTPRPAAEVAQDLGIDEATLRARVEEARPLLRGARAKRPPPLRDDKVQASWNGLMIAAFARGARVLGEARYREVAARAADFVHRALTVDGALQHAWLEGSTSGLAFAEDHAFLAFGLLELFGASGQAAHLERALGHLETLERDHRSPGGGFYRTTAEHEALLARQVEQYDGAIPASSSVAAQAQLLAHRYTTDDRWRKRAETTLGAFATTLRDKPWALTVMAEAIDDLTGSPKEVVIAAAGDADEASVGVLTAVLAQTYAPHHAFVKVVDAPPPALAKLVPWLQGKKPKAAGPTAYVCERGACELPTTDPKVFAQQLASFVPYPGSPAAKARSQP